MYSRKSAEPRMKPWGKPALTDYSCEDFPSRSIQSNLLLRKDETRLNTWSKIPEDLSLWRRAAYQILNIKNLRYIKCYSLSKPKSIKNLRNSIRYHCQKICSWSRRPETILQIRKKVTFLEEINIKSFTLPLKAHRQVSKKHCFKKHCSCDQASCDQLYRVHPDGVI